MKHETQPLRLPLETDIDNSWPTPLIFKGKAYELALLSVSKSPIILGLFVCVASTLFSPTRLMSSLCFMSACMRKREVTDREGL
jgi:hypothetical protein